MNQTGILLAMAPVIEAFERLGIGYYVGGSVASSAHGLPRTTLDVDLVADLAPQQVGALVAALEDDDYIDADAIHDAIRHDASFNLVHLATMVKLDVYVLKRRTYDQGAFARAGKAFLVPQESGFQVALSSAEDVVLYKLHWFRLGGEVSDRQWSDVLGVLKVQGSSLDLQYMRKWADDLQVADLLRQALHAAGLA